MHSIPRYAKAAQTSRGFSLIELSIVVAILSVVATLGLEAAANFVNRTSTAVSRERLVVVDDAVARFFRVYGRLPCPALRTLAPTSGSYGLEDCTIAVLTSTTVGAGLMAGSVPWSTLNIPVSLSLDGFGSKFNYIATKNLTVAGRRGAPSYGAFGDTAGTTATNGVAGIEVRTGVLHAACTGVGVNCQKLGDPTVNTGGAYFIFSSGADQRGAVSARGTTLTTCAIATDSRVDSQNCVFGVNAVRTAMSVTTIPYNVFYDNRYNPGLNLSSYYDDVAIWRTKAQL
jgi:prepilin-type N-terminal cleavage/methylation domain-containing protein